jgi:hypothetical protein
MQVGGEILKNSNIERVQIFDLLEKTVNQGKVMTGDVTCQKALQSSTFH